MNSPTRDSSAPGSILIVASEFPPGTGGIGTYAFEIARNLKQLGWGIHVAAVQGFSTPQRVAVFNAGLDFELHPLPGAGQRSEVFSLIRERRFLAVIAADVHSLRWSWWPTRRQRIPLVAVGHGSEFLRGGLISQSIKKLLYRTVDHVVFNSVFTESAARSHGYRTRSSTIIHPAGGDAVLLDPSAPGQLRQRLGLERRRVFLTVGTVSRRKGQSAVIAAMPRILAAAPDAHYLVVGRETDGGEARQLAEQLNIGHAVTFAGALDDDARAAAYDLAEFNVLPSRNLPDEVEGFGIVVLEAAARGRTTIGTADTGVAEAIIGGKTGVLVPSATADALADAILQLLGDRGVRQRLSAAAAEHAARNTWHDRALQWSELLRRIIHLANV